MKYSEKNEFIKKGDGVPLLNFDESPAVPLLNFGGGRGVPGPTFLEVQGSGSQGSEVSSPRVLVPLLHCAFKNTLFYRTPPVAASVSF